MKRFPRAVLFDVDGTLYHSGILKCLMATELSILPLTKMSFGSACKIWRALSQFRHEREELRRLGAPEAWLADLQYEVAAERVGENPAVMEKIVAEWIYERPLRYLKFCRRPGVEVFFTFLENKSVQIGVFSDYPVLDKLKALDLFDRVSLRLCSTDPEINAFKPHPKGFLYACQIWGLPPEEVLYVGDRPGVDAVGAAAAGMPCAILTKKTSAKLPRNFSTNYTPYSSFEGLRYALSTDL